MVKFKTYEGYLLNIIKSEEESEQMAKLTGYYAVAVIEEVTCCCKKDYYYAVFDDGNTYKAGDQVLVSGCNKDVLTIKEILTVPEAEVKYNKNITLENKVDKSILGGVLVRLGNIQIDGSVKTRLDNIKDQLSQVIS